MERRERFEFSALKSMHKLDSMETRVVHRNANVFAQY